MSDTGAPSAPAEAGAPVGASAPGVADSGPPADATPSAPPEYLPVDEYAGHHVRIKVDGEDLEVPLSEALSGYSRQQDYTRKTQELAQQRQELQYAQTLQKALENNPAATLRLLQEQYGVEATQPQSPTADGDDDLSWLDDPPDPRQQQLDERVKAIEQFRADQELQVALRVLHQQFGEDFDPRAVVAQAMQTGRMDLANIHKEMMFDRLWAQQQAQSEVTQRSQADDDARIAAKAAVTAHGGSSVNGGVEQEPGSAPSIADAFYQAKRQLGY